MRWILAVILGVHGLIHFMGFAKALGLAELPELAQPVSRSLGFVWGTAGVVMLATAITFVAAPRHWWVLGLSAVSLSQFVIITSWSDAKMGTAANILLIVLVAYAFVSKGPLSFEAEYTREVRARLAAPPSSHLVTEADLMVLPEIVRRYLRVTGAVGRPRISSFTAAWRGRIRAAPDEPWMSFTAEQHNFIDDPSRFFHMNARRAGLPVDVLHVFRGGDASMRVRLLSVFPLTKAGGAEFTRAETVTMFNDLCLLAPGALIGPAIKWETFDENSVTAHYTLGPNTITARLVFNEIGELIDFVSDDRVAASPDGKELVKQRWSTPVANYQNFGERRTAASGQGMWHPDTGSFSYIELQLLKLEINPSE